MTNYSQLKLEEKDGILTITINREKKLNALSSKTIGELEEAINYATSEDVIRGIILTGSGEKAFAAGADISELESLNEVNGRKFSEVGQEVFDLFEKCEKPVIAAVNGYALGGGCELAMACHMRIASANAKFGLPELTLGIIPGYGGTQRLPKLVGKGKAFEMILTGDTMDAKEAHGYGLVNHVVDSREELMELAFTILGKILSKAPSAVGQAIACIGIAGNSDENGFQTEANSFANCCKTEDFKEGVRAFLEKRSPDFKGD